ncbi:MAG: NADH:ubiquinone oxidoreductase, NADH-binding subunit [Pseudonocardiales bacterium]|nr:NADH:ubiquinone oxidoreductase, NADH-binding subunit [Pseudonocardiales bacterium]
MTTTMGRLAADPASATWTIGAARVLAGLDRNAVLDARTHLDTHGPLPAADLGRLLGLLDASGLTGRGGAGFPLAAKLRALRGQRPTVVVNGSESEPASVKDRVLLRRTPHLVLDGALAVAVALRGRRVTVAVHDAAAAAAVRTAAAQRPDGNRVRVELVSGGFVAGEARALVRALDGGPALPPGRREHATDHGVLLANAETFAQLAVLIRLGRHRFADTGTRTEPGTTLLTVGGAVGRPGVVELPLGTPLGIVLAAAQAGQPRLVVAGGYHGSWHPAVPAIELSRSGLAAAGGTLGAGVLLVLDDSTCALGELARVTAWLAAESAGQCGPCRFGLPALARDVQALCQGHPGAAEIALRHARAVDGRGACRHPDGTARFVTSALHLLQDETYLHLHHGGCGRPVLGLLPIGGRP